jgi:hypothetical protein
MFKIFFDVLYNNRLSFCQAISKLLTEIFFLGGKKLMEEMLQEQMIHAEIVCRKMVSGKQLKSQKKMPK